MERLPAVRIMPWNAALASAYSLTLKNQADETDIEVPVDGEVKLLPSRCPDSGHLEIRRRSISQEPVASRPFSVVPSDCRIRTPTAILRNDETTNVVLDLPSEASVEWSRPMAPIAPNVYAVGAHERLLEGVPRFHSCGVPFSLRLPRVSVAIELDGKCQPVLWKEFSDRRYLLR